MKKLSYIIILLCLIAIGSAATARYLQNKSPSQDIGLKFTAITDSDNDGIPDWQEEISETDPRDPDSFPYNRNQALIQNISVDDLLYPGPGEFTEEIIRRVRDSGDPSQVTEPERAQFIEDATDYFLESLAKRGLPPVELRVDNSVSRETVLAQIVVGMQAFVEIGSITFVIDRLLVDNASNTEEVQLANTACATALTTLPRTIPADIFTEYRMLLQRIIYTCEALHLANGRVVAEDYFYISGLLSAGELFKDVDITNNKETSAKVSQTLAIIFARLRQQ